MSYILQIKTCIPSGVLAFFFYILLWDILLLFVTRDEIFRFSLENYRLIDKYMRSKSTNLRQSNYTWKYIKFYFYKFLMWISRRSARIIFLPWRYRLLFLCWLSFLLPITFISIPFRVFWLTYWLIRLVFNFLRKKQPLQANDRYDFLVPDGLASVRYTLQNPEDITYTVTHRNGLISHLFEICIWVAIKVPYYRSFDLLFKLSNFKLKSFEAQNPYRSKTILILKIIIFKLVFHIPLYVVKLALSCTISFLGSNFVDSKYYSSYEALQRYLFHEVLYKLFMNKELNLVHGKNLSLHIKS